MTARVLLIDDDPNVLEALAITLEHGGYSIATASSGNMGLRLAEEEAFDLVITDIIMPDKEGLEVMMQLRHQKPGLKVIAMSGGGRLSPEPYLNMATALGARKVLAKPFSASELVAAVEEVTS